MLDCSNLLIVRGNAPTAINIPYLDLGADLSQNYKDFFTETPITDCSFSCNYGNSCGASTTISETNINSASGTNVVTYSQSIKNGYGPETICIECVATNNEIDSHVFTFTQTALDCDPSLVAIPQASPISNPYFSAGPGFIYSFLNFFTFTAIAGCDL